MATLTGQFSKIFKNMKMSMIYNLKLIFAHRFIYFLSGAIISFILFTLLVVLNSDTVPKPSTVYNLLFFPGLIIIFYPCVYGIQLDVDAGMLETLFGIPDYRYKIWLVRLGITYLVVGFILLLLAILCNYVIAPIPVFKMVFHLMFPLLFLGCLAFLLATLMHSGHGAGATILLLGFALWFAVVIFEGTRWNIYHNPFAERSDSNAIVMDEVTFYNRIILLAGAILSLLWGLLNLQKREKFI